MSTCGLGSRNPPSSTNPFAHSSRCRRGDRRGMVFGLGLMVAAAACSGGELGSRAQYRAWNGPNPDRDPFPAFPAPRARAATGGTTACACSGESEQALRIALAAIRAVLDRNPDALGALFYDSVVRVRSQRSVPKAAMIAGCMRALSRGHWRADQRVADIVDIERIRATPLKASHAAAELPNGLKQDDLVVALPLQPTELRASVPCFQYSSQALQLYVRPGPKPGIVAVYR